MIELPYLHRMGEIAAAYGSAPTFDARCAYGWRVLAQNSVRLAHEIQGWLTVRETADAEPYPDAAAMLADIDGGHFLVSSANSEHPVWTTAENVAFRTVHDVLGHHTARSGFDWYGENRACSVHFPLLPAGPAHVALFTECVAQTAYAIGRGGFGIQKVASILPFFAH